MTEPGTLPEGIERQSRKIIEAVKACTHVNDDGEWWLDSVKATAWVSRLIAEGVAQERARQQERVETIRRLANAIRADRCRSNRVEQYAIDIVGQTFRAFEEPQPKKRPGR